MCHMALNLSQDNNCNCVHHTHIRFITVRLIKLPISQYKPCKILIAFGCFSTRCRPFHHISTSSASEHTKNVSRFKCVCVCSVAVFCVLRLCEGRINFPTILFSYCLLNLKIAISVSARSFFSHCLLFIVVAVLCCCRTSAHIRALSIFHIQFQNSRFLRATYKELDSIFTQKILFDNAQRFPLPGLFFPL